MQTIGAFEHERTKARVQKLQRERERKANDSISTFAYIFNKELLLGSPIAITESVTATVILTAIYSHFSRFFLTSFPFGVWNHNLMSYLTNIHNNFFAIRFDFEIQQHFSALSVRLIHGANNYQKTETKLQWTKAKPKSNLTRIFQVSLSYLLAPRIDRQMVPFLMSFSIICINFCIIISLLGVEVKFLHLSPNVITFLH